MLSCVGVLVVPRRPVAAAGARRRRRHPAAAHRDRGGSGAASIGAYAPGPRPHRHASTPTSRRASPACASRRPTSARTATSPAFRDVDRRVPRRPARRQRLVAIYFPFVLLLAATSAPRSCSGPAPCSCADGTITAGTVIAFLLYLDQFFSPIQQLSQVFDTWQQARGVDAPRSTSCWPRRPGTPSRAQPVDPGRVTRRGRASTTCTSATRHRGAEALRGVDLDDRAGRDGRARRRDRRRQVDDREAGRPLLRPDRRRGARRRRRPARARPRRVPPPARLSCPRSRSCSRARSATTSPTAGPTRTDAEVEARGPGRRRPRLHRRPPGGYLHAGHRAGPLAVGRPAPADLPRPGAARRPGDPAARRGDRRTSTSPPRPRAAGDGRRVGRAARRCSSRTACQTARAADRIVVVDDGRIVEEGTHDELLAARRPLRRAVERHRSRRRGLTPGHGSPRLTTRGARAPSRRARAQPGVWGGGK